MKCPHCNVEVNDSFELLETFYNSLSNVNLEEWAVFKMLCPNTDCKKAIIDIQCYKLDVNRNKIATKINIRAYPLTNGRPPVPSEVSEKIAQDYTESCLVLSLSPKASAALSRRCLQNLLREKARVTKKDLAKEIQEVIDSGNLPSYLSESIDAIRNIGNYAAHPLKSTASGEILDVEPGEAEWALDVLEQLFDFYYVQPAKLAAKRVALDAKLATIGKPPMK